MSEFTVVLLYNSTVTPLARMGGSPQSTTLAEERDETPDHSSQCMMTKVYLYDLTCNIPLHIPSEQKQFTHTI